MKKIKIIFYANWLGCLTFTSCGEDSKKDNVKTTMNETNSESIIETNSNSETSISIPTIKIGKQDWMTADLSSTNYNNGDPINEAKSEKQWKDFGNKKIGCYRKLRNGTFVYNKFAVNDERGIIPNGFILPTYDQFNQLIKLLGGGDAYSGKATKSMATYPIYIEDWVGDEETGGLETIEIKTNGSSGFKAKKGGFVYDHGNANEGNCSYWWTSSNEGTNSVVVDLGYCSQDLGGGKGSYSSAYGFAVRAIKK